MHTVHIKYASLFISSFFEWFTLWGKKDAVNFESFHAGGSDWIFHMLMYSTVQKS